MSDKMPFWFSMSIQNSNSPMMEFLLFFNDIVLICIMMIFLLVSILSIFVFKMKFFCSMFPESQSLEDLWLFIPIIFLLFIGFPSIKNLYMFEEFLECDLSIKVKGHQWYWSYSLSHMNLNFDSIMKKEDFNFRLIETFNHLIIPIKSILRFVVSSEDVIHSWTIPSLGIKLDATPGRISQFLSMVNRPGMMIGQCSEICGSNHSFMPIVLSANSIKNFNIFS